MSPIIVGHRGFAGRFPENTLTSIKAACELGVSWIEIDVQLTADEQLVVFHDVSLNRCSNGKGKVAKKTLNELQQLDCGAWFDIAFANEPILTFSQLLTYLATTNVSVNIELKTDSADVEPLVIQVINALKRLNFPVARCLVSSFNHQALKCFHQQEPSVRIGVLSERLSKKDWQTLRDVNAYSCHLNHRWLSAKHIDALKLAHHQIWCYTVNEPQKFKYMDKVDAIFTDFPDRFLP